MTKSRQQLVTLARHAKCSVEHRVPRNDCMAYYDEISEGYEELHKEEQLKKIEIIKQHLQVNKDDLLLDIGCGTGLTTAPWKCFSVGIDPAIKLLKKAKSGIYVNAVAESLPFKENTFDIIISVTAMQNFSGIEKSLEEIRRVAKRDAKIILTYLKKSQKAKMIESAIKSYFGIKERIDEDKDIICIL